MSDLRIENWPISRFTPYAKNPRKNDKAVDRMVASIREFGFKVPMLARSTGEVVDGHLRLKAALKLGLAELPVILCDEWTEAQVKAFRLMVNRSVNWADWDDDLLRAEMTDLREFKFDLALTGFDAREIEDFLADPEADELANEVPELPEQATTMSGDLWLCGAHRVLCSDATLADAVSRLCAGTVPVLATLDPPYGVSYHPMWREEAGLGKQKQTGSVENDNQADWAEAYKLFPGDVAYVWHAGVHAGEVANGLAAAGFDVRAQIIWSKQHFAMSRGHYHWQHEPAWYCVRRGRKSHWRGDRKQSTIWAVANLNPFGGSKDEEATGHGTQKPVELMRRPIQNHTEAGEGVYDCFLGSGTTLVAAEQTGRVCLGMDIDPLYVDQAIMRWQTFTGKVAKLEDGRTFDEVRDERAKYRA
jgi:DNA modification methylase